MTTVADNADGPRGRESANDTLYSIDEQEYRDAGESYVFKVWQRLCWSGECRLCRRFPEGKPVVPGRTNEASIFNAAKICPSKVQFITPGMSLLEAVFRILLANGNEPMKFDDIVSCLKESWGSEFPQRVESVAALQRILEGPNEYRIARV